MISKEINLKVFDRVRLVPCKNRDLTNCVKVFDNSLTELRQFRKIYNQREFEEMIGHIKKVIQLNENTHVEVHCAQRGVHEFVQKMRNAA